MGFSPATEAAPPTASPPPAELPEPASDNGVAPASPQGDQGEGQGLPQPGPGTEATPPETPTEHPWAGAEDVDAVLAVESVATRFADMKTEATEEGRRTAQSQLQPILQANQQRLQGIEKSLGEYGRSWNKLVKSGGITQDEATDIIEGNREAFEVLAGMHKETGRWEGRGEWINLAGKFDGAIPAEFTPRFEALQQGLSDPTFTDDFLKAVGKAVADPIRAELKEAKANIARLEAESRNAGRTANPAPASTSGVGGGVGGGAQPNDLQEARQLHANGEITNAEMRAYKQRLR